MLLTIRLGVIMEKIIIRGSRPLRGELTVSGSKNAALPILFATLITYGISVIENLPDIGDVKITLDILRSFGARITRDADAVYIDTRYLKYREPDSALTSKIRASTYLIGAQLSRFGRCSIGEYGGCNFSGRPIDLHLLAAKTLGAVEESGVLVADRLHGSRIEFPISSVGATVNSLILSASAHGETVIRGFAREPHISSLISFLSSAGADITVSRSEIRVVGRPLSGGRVRIIGDMIEAGSYLAAGLVTGGEVKVRGVSTDSMRAPLDAFSLLGAELSVGDDYITARATERSFPVRIAAEPYPGFPTDLQPIFAPLLARYSGGILRDTVWKRRYGYLSELEKFGVISFPVGEGYIVKKSKIKPARVTAPDLRGGMACVLTALMADGESVVLSASTVLRGYENLAGKLSLLGAQVVIEE